MDHEVDTKVRSNRNLLIEALAMGCSVVLVAGEVSKLGHQGWRRNRSER